MTAFFLFEGDDELIGERVYFDAGTILQQLGVLDDVRSTKGRLTALLAHPITIGGAVLRSLRS